MSKSQAFLQRGQIGRDNLQWQPLIAKCTGKQGCQNFSAEAAVEIDKK